MVEVEAKTFRIQLERWHGLVRRKIALERRLDDTRELYTRLSVRLTEDGIRSSMTQQYRNMDMPHAPGVSDKTGNMVANTMQGEEQLVRRLHAIHQELVQACDAIGHIESWVAILDDDYAKVVRARYRDRIHWREICNGLHMDDSTLYRMIDKAIAQIDNEIRMFA